LIDRGSTERSAGSGECTPRHASDYPVRRFEHDSLVACTTDAKNCLLNWSDVVITQREVFTFGGDQALLIGFSA
jgi:hypothetical protein